MRFFMRKLYSIRLNMNVLVVYCHPEQNSFNGSLKDIAIETFESKGDVVEISDLYQEGFDPVEKAEHYENRVDQEPHHKPGLQNRNGSQVASNAPIRKKYRFPYHPWK